MKDVLETAQARDVMNTRVMAAGRGATGRDLALHLLAGVFSGLPIIDRDRTLLGVVTEFDLLKAVQEGRELETVKADEIMSRPPVTVEEDTPLKDVVKKMIKTNILRVPVVKNQKLLGVISRSDILDHVVAKRMIVAYGAF